MNIVKLSPIHFPSQTSEEARRARQDLEAERGSREAAERIVAKLQEQLDSVREQEKEAQQQARHTGRMGSTMVVVTCPAWGCNCIDCVCTA